MIPVNQAASPVFYPYAGMANPIHDANARKHAADELADGILDDSQKTKLAAIAKVLNRFDEASGAIELGLIDAGEWPGATLCPPPRDYASGLGLSELQVRQFNQLQQAAREPFDVPIAQMEGRRLELLNSGFGADSSAVVEVTSDVSKLRRHAADSRPRRDLALAVLDDGQRAKLAAFEMALQLAREAIELGLIPDPPKGEVLCR